MLSRSWSTRTNRHSESPIFCRRFTGADIPTSPIQSRSRSDDNLSTVDISRLTPVAETSLQALPWLMPRGGQPEVTEYTDLRYRQLDNKRSRPILLSVQHCKSAGSLWTSATSISRGLTCPTGFRKRPIRRHESGEHRRNELRWIGDRLAGFPVQDFCIGDEIAMYCCRQLDRELDRPVVHNHRKFQLGSLHLSPLVRLQY